VAALPWNQWQASSGITGNLGLEYEDKRLDLTLGEGRGRFVLRADKSPAPIDYYLNYFGAQVRESLLRPG